MESFSIADTQTTCAAAHKTRSGTSSSRLTSAGKLDALDLDHLGGAWSDEAATAFEAALLEQRRL